MEARLLSALAGLAVVGLAASALPFRCPRNDPNLAKCTGQGFVNIINSMTVGQKEWSVPALDPLLLPLVPVDKNAGDVLNLNLTFKDLYIREIARNVVLKSVEFDLDKLDLTMILSRPIVNFDGKYTIAGKILWLPIWGSGTMNLKMSRGVNEIFKMRGERRQDEAGKSYWHVVEYTSSLSPGLLSVQFDHLFNGNRILGYGANRLMNAEWKVIYGQLHPITDAHFSNVMKPHWADILKSIPLDEAFPET